MPRGYADAGNAGVAKRCQRVRCKMVLEEVTRTMDARKKKRMSGKRMVKVTLRLPVNVYNSVTEKCNREDTTVSSYVYSLVTDDGQKKIRKRLLDEKLTVYEMVVSVEMLGDIKALSEMLDECAGRTRKEGYNLSVLIRNCRLGMDIKPEGIAWKLDGKDMTYTDTILIIRGYTQGTTEMFGKAEKSAQKVFACPDIVYVMGEHEGEQTGKRGRTNVKGLRRTIVRMPVPEHAEIKAFCGRTGLSVSEYVAMLMTGDKDGRIKAKTASAMRQKSEIVISDEASEAFAKLSKSVNEAAHQVRVASSNVNAFLRDKAGLSLDTVVAEKDGERITLGVFMNDIQAELKAQSDAAGHIAKGYLDMTTGDPKVRNKEGKCRVMTRAFFDTGAPATADILLHPDVATGYEERG